MNLYEETKYILNRNNLRANKALGQNFLIDENIIDNIIEAANISDRDIVIEIGPGLGTLTNELIKKAHKVVAVELDENMVSILNKRFFNIKNLEIINEDILKIDIQKMIDEEKKKASKENILINNVKVVANLPYYISTPIILKLLEKKLSINEIVIMVQKEVADRICAKPGDKSSGSITYMVNYYADAEKIIKVSPSCFIPNPKVESEVIKLNIKKELRIQVEDENKFFNLIQSVFSQRRKKLINVLTNLNLIKDKETADKILKKLQLDENVRAENLSLENFVELNNLLEF